MKKVLNILVVVVGLLYFLSMYEYRKLSYLMTTQEYSIKSYKSKEDALKFLNRHSFAQDIKEANDSIYEINKNLYVCVYKNRDIFTRNTLFAVLVFIMCINLLFCISYLFPKGKSKEKN